MKRLPARAGKTSKRKIKEHISFRNCRIYRRRSPKWRDDYLTRKKRFTLGILSFWTFHPTRPDLCPRRSSAAGRKVVLHYATAEVFHTMEKMFPHCGKKRPIFPHNGKTVESWFPVVTFGCCSFMVSLPQGSPLPPMGGKNFQAARRWISSGVRYFND